MWHIQQRRTSRHWAWSPPTPQHITLHLTRQQCGGKKTHTETERERELPILLLHLIQMTLHHHHSQSYLHFSFLTHTMHSHPSSPLFFHAQRANTRPRYWHSLAESLSKNVRRYKPEGIHTISALDTLPHKGSRADTSDGSHLAGEMKKRKKKTLWSSVNMQNWNDVLSIFRKLGETV